MEKKKKDHVIKPIPEPNFDQFKMPQIPVNDNTTQVSDTEGSLKDNPFYRLGYAQGLKDGLEKNNSAGNYGPPFSIAIKNTTDNVLHNVPLINYDFKNQTDLRYTNKNIQDNGYERFIHQMKFEDCKVGRVVFYFVNYQSKAGPIYLKHVYVDPVNGNRVEFPSVAAYDPYQQQSSIMELKKVFHIGENKNLIIDKIPENATLIINLFPNIEEDGKENQK